MKKKISRRNRELALCISISMLLSFSGCISEKQSDDTDSITTSSSESMEVTTDTMAESASSEETTTSDTETEVTTSNTSVPESTEPSEATIDPTATPTDVSANPTLTSSPKPTKAPRETEVTVTAAPTTPPTSTPTNTATPTPVPTDTPTPTPWNTFPVGYYDVGVPKSEAKAAAKDAIRDLCSDHQTTVGGVGEEMTYYFQIEDTLMLNQQRRADCCTSKKRLLGHQQMSGTFTPMEACASLGAQFDGVDTWYYVWNDHAGEEHWYTDFYQCIYDCTKFLITEHTTCLTTNSNYVYYGVGFSGWGEPDPNFYVNYGWDIPWYEYYLYIGGENQLHPGVLVHFDLYEGIIPDFDRNEPWYKQFVP